MKNLLLFENFENYSRNRKPNDNIDKIRLYNQNKISNPEKKLSKPEVFDEIRYLLRQKEKGIIKEVNVVADVPMQGKGSPEYAKGIINIEKELNKKRGYVIGKGFAAEDSFKNYPQFTNLPKDVKIQIDNTIPRDFSIYGKYSPQQIQSLINKYGYDSYGTIKTFNESQEYNLDASGNILDRYGNIRNIFFDSEYIVVYTEVRGGKNFVIGVPKSLEKQGIEVRIPPDKIIEIFYKN